MAAPAHIPPLDTLLTEADAPAERDPFDALRDRVSELALEQLEQRFGRHGIDLATVEPANAHPC